MDALAEGMLSGPEQVLAFKIRIIAVLSHNNNLKSWYVKQKGISSKDSQVVAPLRRLVADFNGDPFSLYRKLRKRNPSPYMYYMEFIDHVVLGTSPIKVS